MSEVEPKSRAVPEQSRGWSPSGVEGNACKHLRGCANCYYETADALSLSGVSEPTTQPLNKELHLGPGILWRDRPIRNQLPQTLVQGTHAELLPGLDGGIYLGDLVLPDKVSDSGGDNHDFMGRHPASTDLPEQNLGNHGLERLRQHGPDDILLGGGEHIHDTMDGPGGGTGVQGPEYQVTGLGGSQGKANGIRVAHLPYQDDIRVLPQRRAQCRTETTGMAMHLALTDQGFFALVNELDGVFHRQDMTVLGIVSMVHHGREGGGLAGTGRPRHQHQTEGEIGDIAEAGRGLEFRQGGHDSGDDPKHRPRTAILGKGVDAKPGKTRDLEGKIHLEKLRIILALSLIHDGKDQLMHRRGIEGRHIDAPHIPVHPNQGRQPRRKMQIGATVLYAESEQFGDVHGGNFSGGVGIHTPWRMVPTFLYKLNLDSAFDALETFTHRDDRKVPFFRFPCSHPIGGR